MAQSILKLRTRDKQNHPSERIVPIETTRIAIVVMDMWNSHWDATYTARSAAIVPAMNQFLHNARAAGAVVIFSPTVLIDYPGNVVYGSTRQRAAAKCLADLPLPDIVPFEPAEPRMWMYDEIGMDGKPAPSNRHSGFGTDLWPLSAQCAGLDIEEPDYFVGDGERAVQELWNVMQKHRIAHVLYLGGALHWCLYIKPIGVYYLKQRGISTMLVRELVEGWSVPRHWYNHADPFPPEAGEFSHDKADEMMIHWYERNVAPSTSINIFPRRRTIKSLRLKNAHANFSPPGFPAGHAIDDSPLKNHGWANSGNPANTNALVVQLAAGADNQANEDLIFVLDFFAHVKRSGLGRFRLSATADHLTSGESTRANWLILSPTSARTLSTDSQIRINSDQSLQVQAQSPPDFDRYVIHAKNPLGKKVSGFRLEAMADESLPGGGPGFGADGNFVLNGFMVRSVHGGSRAV